MASYIRNLTMVELSRERARQVDVWFSASESQEFSGVNGSLRCFTKDLLDPFQLAVKMLQRRHDPGCVGDLLRANDLVDEIERRQILTFILRLLDSESCGLLRC